MSTTQPKTYESIPPCKVAFLGLGVMGLPMAGHLALAGHDVTVYNRSPAKAQAWVGEFKGRAAPTPREAAAGCDIVFAVWAMTRICAPWFWDPTVRSRA